MNINSLRNDELAIFSLRELYEQYGFTRYKMSKFEEYDLYVRNKDFLVSDNIITFTDTDGKLMALKPDVTLSIIKNTADTDSAKKVYYDENVYRVSKGTNSYKEIMQTGLECIGCIDNYNIYEVISLALKSLETISPDYILDISHLGIVSRVLDGLNITEKARQEIVNCLSEKNAHGISQICEKEEADASEILALVYAYGSVDSVLEKLCDIPSVNASPEFLQLKKITTLLTDAGFDKIRIDFSVINDMNYYNGFVFRGFINGISSGILSGGQYDELMKKMKRKSGAVGFAVYLDMLELLSEKTPAYDVDTLLLYDDGADLKLLSSSVSMLTASGSRVMAQKTIPEKIKYRQLLRLGEKGVEIIENNA